MRTVLISVAIVAAGAVLNPAPAAGQRTMNREIKERFDSLARQFDPNHWNRHGNPAMGAVRAGVWDTTEMQLASSTRYVALGLCAGCTALHMQVFAPNGTKLGEAMGAGTTPRVEFTTTALGRYRILSHMPACGQNAPQCDIGVQLMRYR